MRALLAGCLWRFDLDREIGLFVVDDVDDVNLVFICLVPLL